MPDSAKARILVLPEDRHPNHIHISNALATYGFAIETKPCSVWSDWEMVRSELTADQQPYAAAIVGHAFVFHMKHRSGCAKYPSLGQHLKEVRDLIGESPVIVCDDLIGLGEICGDLKEQGFHGMDWGITVKETSESIRDIVHARPSTSSPLWLGGFEA